MSNVTPQSKVSAQALLKLFQRGVGTGTEKAYEGFFTTANVDTASHSGKGFCALEGRYRHWLSETEEGLLLGSLRDPFVTGARESFPLTIALTKRICETFAFRHIRSSGSGRPLVPYTTDLLISRSTPPLHIALSGKVRRHLRKIENYRSMMVEHVYWSLYDVPHLVATEAEFTKEVLISLRNLRPPSHLAEADLLSSPNCRSFHVAALAADWSEPLIEVVRTISTRLRIGSEEGMALFKRLAWAGNLEVDLHLGITPRSRNVLLPSGGT
ncbi:hypothetical protein KBW71_18545 [Hydrogenophaga aromaticivorans]|uniref:hypothetical protein n=1 Tax=Hydrogenophaga aromaticivorans TaxID=2610898 RepID=UPI001B37550E|nr:hypothetical protein [Hydrogenophaga aromaticivorans]MBQ0920438.1 hypothetical protein [Hydrogenophaga aromaticivorans]